MVQSLNQEVCLTTSGTLLMGLTEYGNIMIGDKAFEFYSSRDARKFIQIPWEEINYVSASVLFGGKWIPRFTIITKSHGSFIFSSKHPKKTLKTMRQFLEKEQMVKALGFFDVIKRGIKRSK